METLYMLKSIKYLTCVSGFFLFWTHISNAEPLSFTIEDKVYRCEEQQTAVDPLAAQNCAAKAYQGPFSREQSLLLCAGANSNIPVDCALKAYSGPLSAEQSISFCTGAVLQRNKNGFRNCRADRPVVRGGNFP